MDNRRAVRAVVFDFDYTLADSSRGIVESINYALMRAGLEPAPEREICATIGLPVEEAFRRLRPSLEAGCAAELVRLFFLRAEEVMVAGSSLYADTIETASALRGRGLALGIVSTKLRRRILQIVSLHGARHLFDVVVGGEDVKSHKPDPEGLLAAIRELRTSPEITLYVGDSVVDAMASQRAGTPFVAVTTGTTTAAEFAGLALPCVRAVVPNLLSLLHVVGLGSGDPDPAEPSRRRVSPT